MASSGSVLSSVPCFQSKVRPFSDNESQCIFDFLSGEDLARAEAVCWAWHNFIKDKQWKRLCQIQLNIPFDVDPTPFFPNDLKAYKEGARYCVTKVYDSKIYERILGASVPPIREKLSLTTASELDPWNEDQTKGQGYVWIDVPPYFKISVGPNFPFELDKEDDPRDEEAPRLVETANRSNLQNRELKVPNTIHNLEVLFQDSQTRYPSKFDIIWKEIREEHGNKRITPGRVVMREDIIGRGKPFDKQKQIAEEAGCVIAELGHRILYNFLRNAECGSYPDSRNGAAIACTATLFHSGEGAFPISCGWGTSKGLNIDVLRENGHVGAAVALPPKNEA